MEMNRIYISGPISGTNDYIRRFAKAQTHLEKTGWHKVINPAAIIYQMPPGISYAEIMAMDIALLSHCDTIYMLRGWEDSQGCIIERTIAAESNMRILYEDNAACCFD